MKQWYAVGPDLRLTDGIHCSYFDNAIILMGLTTQKELAMDYIKQYQHFVDFRILQFNGPDDYFDSNFPISDILRIFGILDNQYYTSNLLYDIDLVRGSMSTIHPSNFIFTMLQYNAYVEESSGGLYVLEKMHDFAVRLSSLHILSKYIRDNEDINGLIINLMTRYLALSGIPSYHHNDVSRSLLSLFGYDNNDLVLERFICIEKMVEEFMLRWDLEY